MSKLPIKFFEHFNLMSYGVSQAACNYSAISLGSDKFVCIVNNVADKRKVMIIDINDPKDILERPITADSAIMHPSARIVALKGKTVNPSGTQLNLQIFNIELKLKVNQCVMYGDISFWTWISPEAVGIVTESAVYHWEMSAESQPKIMFSRLPNLICSTIIGYKADSSFSWFCLIGISAQENRVVGAMQLYSKSQDCSQAIEAHAASFAQFTVLNNPSPSNLICLTTYSELEAKLHVIEVGTPPKGNAPFPRRSTDLLFDKAAVNDFPTSMHVSDKHKIIYLITKYGYIYLYDLETLKSIYSNRVSGETIFVTALQSSSDGIVGVNRLGQVISVAPDPDVIVPYVRDVLKDNDLAISLALRNSWTGVENLLVEKFENLLADSKYGEAVRIAALAPNNILRTPKTVQILRNLPHLPNQTSPLLQYFASLLDLSGLNSFESVELCRLVLQQNKINLVEKWLLDDKLHYSEELGDVVKIHDPKLALSIFLRANIPQKVVSCFVASGQIEKVSLYAKKTGYVIDRPALLREIILVNPGLVRNFVEVFSKELLDLKEVEVIADVLIGSNMVEACTALLLEVLQHNRPSEGPLQTKLLAINLTVAPQVADAILGNRMFTHYDKNRVAQLCENCGLTQWALENYSDLRDIKRLISNTPQTNIDWWVEYFGKISPSEAYECVKSLLSSKLYQNVNLSVAVLTRYHKYLDVHIIIEIFESFECVDGLFTFLNTLINESSDSDVHYKYIEVSCKIKKFDEAVRICQNSNYYNSEKVKNLLKDPKLSNQMPLLVVCDRFGFVDELVLHLHQNRMYEYLDRYLEDLNPKALPQVISTLLGVGCDDEIMKKLIYCRRGDFSVDDLFEILSRQNKLKLFLPWLEHQKDTGSTDTAIHNVLAKIYIVTNNDPEGFLTGNQFYDSKVVGAFCEQFNINLACVVYERGQCDSELLKICNENSLFKNEAKYLIRRKNIDLWSRVLMESNHKKQLIDHVVQTILTETHDADDISTIVKAFMVADLPTELIELLERLIFESPIYKDNKNLQNLLLVTAIKTKSPNVLKYLDALDNYDALELGEFAMKCGLFEESLIINDKIQNYTKSMTILLRHINDLERAELYAVKCNEKRVWCLLAEFQVENNLIKKAMESYGKAEDFTAYKNIIEKSKNAESWEDLIDFLQLVRKSSKDLFVDNELVYALAKTNRIVDLHSVLNHSSNLDVLKIADECFNDQMYEVAKILYGKISHYSKLALTYLRTHELTTATDCARKSKDIKILKEVCFACVESSEFNSAQLCGIHIAVRVDELENLIKFYEFRGHFTEIIKLLEMSLGMEGVHMGIFTELAILYCKYQPNKVRSHLDLFWDKMNISKVIKTVESAHMWEALVFLQTKSENYDETVKIMMSHPTETFARGNFEDFILKVVNNELIYQAIDFYLKYKPLLLNDFLLKIHSRLDHCRATDIFIQRNQTKLIKNYLQMIQSINHKTVNELLNNLLIEGEDFYKLKLSIDTFDNFNHSTLAAALENHELIEFRKIAAHLYQTCENYSASIEICVHSGLFKEAILYAAESDDSNSAEYLIEWFLQTKNIDYFVACLYQCYSLLRPDVVLELSWKNGVVDWAMPYFIQVMSEFTNKVRLLGEAEKPEKQLSDAQFKITYPSWRETDLMP